MIQEGEPIPKSEQEVLIEEAYQKEIQEDENFARDTEEINSSIEGKNKTKDPFIKWMKRKSPEEIARKAAEQGYSKFVISALEMTDLSASEKAEILATSYYRNAEFYVDENGKTLMEVRASSSTPVPGDPSRYGRAEFFLEKVERLRGQK